MIANDGGDLATPAHRVARVVARALEAPAALFARIDGSGVTVASWGLPQEAVSERPSVAELAAVDALVLIADLTADPRFAESAWARVAPGARALALAPARDGGRRVGVVAVIDTRPRSWTPRESDLLADLAALAAERTADDLRAAHRRVERDLTERLALNEHYRAMVESWPDGGMVSPQDITARVTAEKALRDSEERYRLLFEKAGEGIIIAETGGERAGTIVEANAAACAMHGYTRDELTTLKVSAVVVPEGTAFAAERIRRVGDGEWVVLENFGRRKDGSRFPVSGLVGPLDAGGERYAMCFLRDVTERVGAEAQLREARDAAEAANRAKSAFLANMSHEIRTPMNAILGYTQLLQRDPKIEPEHQRYLDVISRSGDHLLDLINDVLEMSKIEAGFYQLHRGTVDLQSMLGDLERTFLLRANGKRLSLDIHRAAGVPRYIVTDEGKLRRMLGNLIGNAVKFTERGAVVARLSVPPAGDGADRLVVEIEDTGPGIAPDEIGTLFQPFVQSRVGIEAQGGTGLGLALSREFARLMGGDVTVESTVGVGSVFRVDVPLELDAKLSPPAEPLRPGQVIRVSREAAPPRILVVDDEDANRTWLCKLLELVGFEVREATNGAEALSVFDGWRPRVVLMDLHMPAMDGFTAMRALRARPEGPPVAIIAVTASAFDDTRDAIFDAGADGWLRKPCREGPLLSEIARLIGVQYHHATPPTPSQPTPEARGADAGARLPPEVIDALRIAARIADYERLSELAGAMSARNAPLADDLRHLLDRYDYDEIHRLLEGM